MKVAVLALLVQIGRGFAPPRASKPALRRASVAFAVPAAAPAASTNGLARVVGGTAALVAIDEASRYGLRAAQLALPHSLVGGASIILVLTLLRSRGAAVHAKLLAPGAALLLAWMPCFFAPALVALPLAPPLVSSAADAAKVLVVVLGGLLASLGMTLALTAPLCDAAPAAAPKKVPAPRFGKAVEKPIAAATAACAALLVGGCAAPQLQTAAPQLQTAALGGATLLAYIGGKAFETGVSRMKPTPLSNLLKLAHPVVVCAALTTGVLRGVCAVTGLTTTAVTQLYVRSAGAALQRLLGPAVLALACGIYARRADVAQNARAVAAAMVSGVACGLYGTALAARCIGLPLEARLALIPRCITTPLALAICEAVPGTPRSAAVAIVVVTGVLGAAVGQGVLSMLEADRRPVARGLAMGAAAHGIGTAQLSNEAEAQPFAAISMSLVGAASVICASLGPSRRLLLWLAGA